MSAVPTRSPAVAAPRLAGALIPVEHDRLGANDEWTGETVESADLIGVEADHVLLSGCVLRGVRFTGARLDQLQMTDVELVDCELSGLIATESSFRRVAMRNCRMTGIVLSNAKLRDVSLTDCKLDDANLRFTASERVRFDGCSLVAADLTAATVTDCGFARCDLRRADVTKISIKRTRLAGSKIDGLRGAGGVRGVVLSSDQVLPLALAMFGGFGISIDDEPES